MRTCLRFAPLPLALLLLSLSCSKAPPPAPPPGPPPTAPVEPAADTFVTAADQQCSADADCALTTEDCCGCTSLGKQIGVRKDRLAALSQRRTPVCSAISCPATMSDDPTCLAQRAKCLAGSCVPDVVGAKPPAGLGVAPIDDAK